MVCRGISMAQSCSMVRGGGGRPLISDTSPPSVTCCFAYLIIISQGLAWAGCGGPGGSPPAETYPIHREQNIYWRMNNSGHGPVMLSAVNKGNSSLNVKSGFPHLTNTQQLPMKALAQVSLILMDKKDHCHLA